VRFCAFAKAHLVAFWLISSALAGESRTNCVVGELIKSTFANVALAEGDSKLVLRTNRLVVRAIGPQQSREVAEVWNHTKVIEMSGDHALDPEWLNSTLKRGATRFTKKLKNSRRPFINFGIYSDGNFVGTCQIAAGQEFSIHASGLGNSRQKWVSISFHLHPDAWGKGTATEVGERIVRFAFEDLEVDGVHGEAIVSNIASQKALQKIGFKPVNLLDPPYLHFYIDRLNYKAK
jgi:RimJ/RimL family protein N-acetyltransferase